MKNKYSHSVLVYMKKKHAYTKREEQLETLAMSLKGKCIGGGTDLTTGKRDQQYFFRCKQDADTFLNYPTVKEAILTDVEVVVI